MKTVFSRALCFLMLSLAAVACSPGGSAELAFEDAWVRPLPPGMKMTAAFGTFRNPGPEAIELVSFSSPVFGDVSLHRTELVDGVSKMRGVKALIVPAGDAVELAPGGYHLMLMMPVTALNPEQPLVVLMTAADGSQFAFEIPFERR
jgi:copper(I)-binding protein